jgi:hypothetical protein
VALLGDLLATETFDRLLKTRPEGLTQLEIRERYAYIALAIRVDELLDADVAPLKGAENIELRVLGELREDSIPSVELALLPGAARPLDAANAESCKVAVEAVASVLTRPNGAHKTSCRELIHSITSASHQATVECPRRIFFFGARFFLTHHSLT